MPWTNLEQTKVDVITILGLPADAPRWVELVQRKLERLPWRISNALDKP